MHPELFSPLTLIVLIKYTASPLNYKRDVCDFEVPCRVADRDELP